MENTENIDIEKKQKKIEYMKNYRLKHKEHIDEYMKQYKIDNKDDEKKYNKKYYENRKSIDGYKTKLITCDHCKRTMQERSLKRHLLNCKLLQST
jgi:hypothetical protein